ERYFGRGLVRERETVLGRAGLRKEEAAVAVAVDHEDVVPARVLGRLRGRAQDEGVDALADDDWIVHELPRALVTKGQVIRRLCAGWRGEGEPVVDAPQRGQVAAKPLRVVRPRGARGKAAGAAVGVAHERADPRVLNAIAMEAAGEEVIGILLLAAGG